MTQSIDSLRRSGQWSKVAIQLSSRMAESEARRMLALKTQQALTAQKREPLPVVKSPSISSKLR